MPRRKKPHPEMTDSELFESLFPKQIRKRIEQELEAEEDAEDHEKAEVNRSLRSTDGEDR
jgi:hypothetical protein